MMIAMANGIRVNATGTLADEESHVYVSLPEAISSQIWSMADFLRTSSVVTHNKGNGRVSAKFTDVYGSDLDHFLACFNRPV